jgi:hypothetical protein
MRCDHRRRTQTRGRRTIATRSLLRPGRACDSASSDDLSSLECGFCSLRRRRNVSQAVSEARLRERGGRGSMIHCKQRGAAGDGFGMSARGVKYSRHAWLELARDVDAVVVRSPESSAVTDSPAAHPTYAAAADGSNAGGQGRRWREVRRHGSESRAWSAVVCRLHVVACRAIWAHGHMG